nr:MAG TPA: hypothetical protein [Caudoviricetes sp.]
MTAARPPSPPREDRAAMMSPITGPGRRRGGRRCPGQQPRLPGWRRRGWSMRRSARRR